MTISSRVTCLYVLAACFALLSSFPALAVPNPVKVSGYLQTRYVNDQAASYRSDFMVRRARVKLSGSITEDVSVNVSFDVAMSTLLKDTYVQWAKGPSRFALGQQKVPFGFEIPQSDADRLSLERDKVFSIFPSTYDRGVVFNYTPSRPGIPVTFTAAALNGNGEASDNNNAKNLAFRAQAKPKWGGIGASYYTGNFATTPPAPPVTTAAVRTGFDFQYDRQPVGWHGEFVGGRASGKSIQGWYLEGIYSVPKKPGVVFVRQSAFDPNTDLASDDYRRTLIGYVLHLDSDDATRLTFQYGFVTDKKTGGSDNAFGVQFQVKY